MQARSSNNNNDLFEDSQYKELVRNCESLHTLKSIPFSTASFRASGDAATFPPWEAAGFEAAGAFGAAAAPEAGLTAAAAGAGAGFLGAAAAAAFGATKSLNAAMSPSSWTKTQRSYRQ